MKLLGARRDPSAISAIDMRELWSACERYGAVRVWPDRRVPLPGRYCVLIAFETVPGVELEAKSDFDLTIEEALVQAAERAGAIVASSSARGQPAAERSEAEPAFMPASPARGQT